LEETVAAITSAGGQAAAVQCDIGSHADCDGLITECVRHYGPPDILVNNAAVFEFRRILDYSPEQLALELNINVMSTIWLSQLALSHMTARRCGCIINISSPAVSGPGRGPYTVRGNGFTLYGAGKAFIERFTQGLAQEVYQDRVSVTCYSPSMGVMTPGMHKLGGMRGRSAVDAERAETTARAALLLATLPPERISGRVGYSQALLKEFGWAETARGAGVDRPGSGFSTL
jgi:NAD(P)-dependent dehydrogenase (short-subunit alcohol dehydrogenase family)